MKELGYTVMKKDVDGNDLREHKTTPRRGIYIYINLKGRIILLISMNWNVKSLMTYIIIVAEATYRIAMAVGFG